MLRECRKRRLVEGSHGQTLVEFALTLPILLLLTIVVIDMGRAVYTYNTLSDCARAGARFGIVLTDDGWGDPDYQLAGNTRGTYATATAYVGTNTIVGQTVRERGILDPAQMKINVDYIGDPDMHLKVPLTVTVEYTFQPAISYIVGSAAIPMKAQSVMFIQ